MYWSSYMMAATFALLHVLVHCLAPCLSTLIVLIVQFLIADTTTWSLMLVNSMLYNIACMMVVGRSMWRTWVALS